jgi:hypothetical protein
VKNAMAAGLGGSQSHVQRVTGGDQGGVGCRTCWRGVGIDLDKHLVGTANKMWAASTTWVKPEMISSPHCIVQS